MEVYGEQHFYHQATGMADPELEDLPFEGRILYNAGNGDVSEDEELDRSDIEQEEHEEEALEIEASENNVEKLGENGGPPVTESKLTASGANGKEATEKLGLGSRVTKVATKSSIAGVKKNSPNGNTSGTQLKPFLRSSSSAAAARRQEAATGGSNGSHSHANSSTSFSVRKSNGALSCPTTPRGSGAAKPSLSLTPTTPRASIASKTPTTPKSSTSSRTPTTPKALSAPKVPTLKRRASLGSSLPTTDPSNRRASLGPSLTPSKPSPSVVDPSRRASLTGLASRSAPSASELKKWASSPSTSSSRTPKTPTSTSTSRVTSSSAAGSGTSKPSTDYLRRSSSSLTPKTPNTPIAKSPGLRSSSSKILGSSPKSPGDSLSSQTSIASSTRSQITNGVHGSIGTKKISPASAGVRRSSSSRVYDHAVSTSRSTSSLLSSSTDRTAMERSQNGALRRKSLTPDSKDPKLIALPFADGKAGDDVRLDLKGQKVKSLDPSLINLNPKLEFVYLRDNKLSDLSGIEILKRVKVLDLSFNEFKGAGLEPLENCKGLQQLYLAGNQITSLSGLPEFPNLEFLSVAQNKLKSLAMATQPRLQVLAASKNKISTLKGFPYLPSLEHLRLEENPILEFPHVEAASILLVGPTLKKFNDRDLSIDEQQLAQLYPAFTPMCIREGWEFCSPEDAVESTMQFMVEQWKDNLPPGYKLVKAFMDRPFEEDPCHAEFLFEKESSNFEESDIKLQYQWFIGERTPTNFELIENATEEVYWPRHDDVGRCLKVQCTPSVGEKEYPPVFVASFPVSPGTGSPKVLKVNVEGELIEGNLIRGSAEVAWCGGTPGAGVVSWLRRTENGTPVAIIGAEDYEYCLTVEDVGTKLLFMYTPVTEEGVRGESQYAMTTIIQAAPPHVSSVQITGDVIEGNVICGTGNYSGGREGASKFEWLREDPETGEFKLAAVGNAEYFLTEQDVGLQLMFIYTPVSTGGAHGNSVSAISSKVLLAPPRVAQLRIVGDLREGNKVVVSGTFIGGVEGASRVQWFKTQHSELELDESLFEPISTSKVAKAFRIPLGAVGHYLVAKYTPVRSDGESGQPGLVISETPVEMLPPSLNFLTINGGFVEGETLTASYGYVGGHEGSSQYHWYLHEDECDPGTPLPGSAGQLQYRVTKEAVNRFISFKCVPIRDDGVVGEGRNTMTQEPIKPGSPKLLTLHIFGDPREGSDLKVEKTYWGGNEGASKLQWFLTSADGTQREIRGAVDNVYTVRCEDIDGLICCSCEPIREDGAKGPISVSQLLGPVVPAPPSCEHLEICGPLVEGGCLTFKATYKGGFRGPCRYEWLRKVGKEEVHLSDNEVLYLTSEEVGAQIKFIFMPVRLDGLVGSPCTVISDVVTDADPEGKDLVIEECFEDISVIPRKTYFGGQEGESQYMWYRTGCRLDGTELPIDARYLSSSMIYKPKLEDVGSYLVLQWLPIRRDGKRGEPLIACTRRPVAPAPPIVKNVRLKSISSSMFVGGGDYYGGMEGDSQISWYRETADGSTMLIEGATSKTYVVMEDDYTCRIIFGYTPVRDDGAVGDLVLSEPSNIIYPDLPRVQKLVLSGKVIEGEVLTALEVMPKGDVQQRVWEKYKKDVKYQWSRTLETSEEAKFEIIPLQRSCTYKVRLEDVGYCLQCECIVSDIFGRTTEPVYATTQAVVPGLPRIDKLEIEGRGFHTNLYAVRGLYSGGKEGKSTIQWFRAMAGSPDLIPIPGEVGRMYEANVDDVGYRLVAIYTPFREDGVEGNPTSASTEPIEVEPEVSKEVKQKLELGAVKFEVLRDRDRSPLKVQQQQGLGSLERRILDVNRKRIKVVKPGSKTSFQSTEIRGSYAPPFHVELFRNDQHRLKIVIDSENEVDLMVRTRHIRDVIALVIRGLAQRYNSTPLNLLLKM